MPILSCRLCFIILFLSTLSWTQSNCSHILVAVLTGWSPSFATFTKACWGKKRMLQFLPSKSWTLLKNNQELLKGKCTKIAMNSTFGWWTGSILSSRIKTKKKEFPLPPSWSRSFSPKESLALSASSANQVFLPLFSFRKNRRRSWSQLSSSWAQCFLKLLRRTIQRWGKTWRQKQIQMWSVLETLKRWEKNFNKNLTELSFNPSEEV